MKKILTALVAATALTLTGCGSSEPTEEYTPNSEYTTQYEEPALSDSDMVELTDEALQNTWDDMTATEQMSFCNGWTTYPEISLDSFMEAAGDSFTRTQVKDFFESACE